MNRALKSALIELRSEGVNLDPIADLEHILTLHNLALQISTPRTAPGEAAALRPVLCVGNITLRHLSLGARRFLVDVVGPWFPRDMQMQDLAYAYCMAVGHEPEILWAVQSDRRAFEKCVRKWEKTVGVSYDTLRLAIQSFIDEEKAGQVTHTSPNDYRAAIDLLDRWKPMAESYKMECNASLIAMQAERNTEASLYGKTIEVLVQEYGRTPEDWIWRTPETEVEILLSARNERLEAEARAVKGAQDDRFMRAHHAFVEYKDMILKLKKGAIK